MGQVGVERRGSTGSHQTMLAHRGGHVTTGMTLLRAAFPHEPFCSLEIQKAAEVISVTGSEQTHLTAKAGPNQRETIGHLSAPPSRGLSFTLLWT